MYFLCPGISGAEKEMGPVAPQLWSNIRGKTIIN